MKLHPSAVLEYEDSVRYYASHAPSVAIPYRNDVLAMLDRVCGRPASFRRMPMTDLRCASICRFPYRLIFRADEHMVFVLALSHYRRRPLYWAARA